jgi:hypothetical protein
MERIEFPRGERGIASSGVMFQTKASSVSVCSIRSIRTFKIVDTLNRTAHEHERQLSLVLASTNVNTD